MCARDRENRSFIAAHIERAAVQLLQVVFDHVHTPTWWLTGQKKHGINDSICVPFVLSYWNVYLDISPSERPQNLMNPSADLVLVELIID